MSWRGSQQGASRHSGIVSPPSPQSSRIFFGCSGSPSAVCPFACTAPLRSAPCGLACLSCPPLCIPISGESGRELLKAAQGSATLTLPKVCSQPTSAPCCHRTPTCSVTNLLTSWSSGRNSFQLRPPSRHSFPAVFWPCGKNSWHQHTMPSISKEEDTVAWPMTQTLKGMPLTILSGGRGVQSPQAHPAPKQDAST